jgi:tetratricopeptide (TPR) repeat protein
VAVQGQDSIPVLPLDGTLDALALDPSERQPIESALKSHDYPSAESALLQSATKHPEVPLIYNYLGRIFFVDGKYLNAAIALKKAEVKQPLSEKDRFTLAMAYVAVDHPDWARPELEKLTQVDPRNPLYPYWQGRLDYDKQSFSQAVTWFEKAIALDSDFMKAYDNLGLCLESLGKFDEAIQQYQHAIRLNREHNTHSAWPSLNLGTLLVKLNRLEEAEPLFKESVQYDPNFAQAHYQFGVLLGKQNKTAPAVEELQRAATLDPAYSQPHYALARVYRQAGEIEQAKRELEIFARLKDKAAPAPQSE